MPGCRWGDVAERGVAGWKKFGGAGVDVEIKLEAQAEEDVGGVLVGRDARVAEGAEDGVDSSRSISTAWRMIFSRRNLSAPQSKCTNSRGRLCLEAAAWIALTATGVTTPMPSPGMTAMRAFGPPLRRGMLGTSCSMEMVIW